AASCSLRTSSKWAEAGELSSKKTTSKSYRGTLAAPHHFDDGLGVLRILRAHQQAPVLDGLAYPGNAYQLPLHAKQQVVSLGLFGDPVQLGNTVLIHFQQDEVSLALVHDGRHAPDIGLGQYGLRQGIQRSSAYIDL